MGIGRLTLTGNACGANPPIAWLNAFNSAFVLGTDSSIELGAFEPQTTGLTLAAMAGTYYVGTSEVASQSDQAEVGILTLASNGVVTGTTDVASISTQSAGAATSDTYTLTSQPFTHVSTVSPASGSTSSLTHGPTGQNVSNPLARVHCPSFFCRSRAVTSLASV